MTGSRVLETTNELLRWAAVITTLAALAAEHQPLKAAEKAETQAQRASKSKAAKRALRVDAARDTKQPPGGDPGGIDRQVASNLDVVNYGGEYRIGPGDVLQIIIWKEPEMSMPTVAVRPDGKISMLLIGEVSVRGLSPAILENLLTTKYAEYIKEARVSVLVKEINSQKVYVIGEVKKEGAIRLQSPMTILQAIAEAGGLTDYARKKHIYVLRLDGHTVGFDYDSIVRGQKVEQNILVAPGDTIIVPR